MRTRIIRDTADIYRPDLFIVDKEPLGLRGEVGPALRLLKERGTPLVLGLRDVMDDPAALAQEWERKNVVPALRDLYDEIWIYGLPQINKPLAGIDLPASVRHKIDLHRLSAPRPAAARRHPARDRGDRRAVHPGHRRRRRRRRGPDRLGARAPTRAIPTFPTARSSCSARSCRRRRATASGSAPRSSATSARSPSPTISAR